MSRKNSNNPFYLLLIKYYGELLDASPDEIARAEKRCGSSGEIKRARRQANKTYDTYYDANGVRKIDNVMRQLDY